MNGLFMIFRFDTVLLLLIVVNMAAKPASEPCRERLALTRPHAPEVGYRPEARRRAARARALRSPARGRNRDDRRRRRPSRRSRGRSRPATRRGPADEHVRGAVANENRDRDPADVEAPRRDARKIVVTQPSTPVAACSVIDSRMICIRSGRCNSARSVSLRSKSPRIVDGSTATLAAIPASSFSSAGRRTSSPAIAQPNSSTFTGSWPASHASCSSPGSPSGAGPTMHAALTTRSGSRAAQASE